MTRNGGVPDRVLTAITEMVKIECDFGYARDSSPSTSSVVFFRKSPEDKSWRAKPLDGSTYQAIFEFGKKHFDNELQYTDFGPRHSWTADHMRRYRKDFSPEGTEIWIREAVLAAERFGEEFYVRGNREFKPSAEGDTVLARRNELLDVWLEWALPEMAEPDGTTLFALNDAGNENTEYPTYLLAGTYYAMVLVSHSSL